MPRYGDSTTSCGDTSTFEGLLKLRPRSGTNTTFSKAKLPEIAELDDFSRLQRFLKRPLSFGGASALLAVGLGTILVSNKNKRKMETERDETLKRRETEVDEAELQRDEKLLRIEKMVAQPKSVAMVVRADEIMGKKSILQVLVQERDGWFWKGRQRVLRVKGDTE